MTSPGVRRGQDVSWRLTIKCPSEGAYAMPGIVFHGAQFGRGPQRIRDALSGALVIMETAIRM